MKSRELFIVKLAIELGLVSLAGSLGAPWLARGIVGDILAKVAGYFLGELVDKGILVIDLGVDAIRVAFERKEYRDAAVKAYGKAKARVYTEEEKRAIRKEFQDIIRKYGPLLRVREQETNS